MIRAIVAVDEKWGIGRDGKLLFSVPEDMAFFRETTMGKTVVMGRKTLESFPGGKPLKNRVNIVLSADGKARGGCVGVSSLAELRSVLRRTEGDVYVIGGAKVYAELLAFCAEVLVTKIDADGKADVFFPNLDKNGNFRLIGESGEKESNGYRFRFTRYCNIRPEKL